MSVALTIPYADISCEREVVHPLVSHLTARRIAEIAYFITLIEEMIDFTVGL